MMAIIRAWTLTFAFEKVPGTLAPLVRIFKILHTFRIFPSPFPRSQTKHVTEISLVKRAQQALSSIRLLFIMPTAALSKQPRCWLGGNADKEGLKVTSTYLSKSPIIPASHEDLEKFYCPFHPTAQEVYRIS